MKKTFITILSTILLSSCATSAVKSHNVSAAKSGLSYALPMQNVSMTLKADANCKTNIKLQTLPSTADNSLWLTLAPEHSIFRNDTFTLETSKEGLLKSAKLVAKGEITNVIANLNFKQTVTGNTFDCPLNDEIIVFDPTNKAKRDGADKKAAQRGLIIAWDPRLNEVRNSDSLITEATAEDIEAGSPYIYYRRPGTFWVTVRCADNTCEPEARNMTLAQGSPLMRIDLKATPLTDTEDTIDFDGGVPTKLTVKRPSELASAATLPAQLLERYFAIPTELLTFRTQQRTLQTGAETADELRVLRNQIRISCLTQATTDAEKLKCYEASP